MAVKYLDYTGLTTYDTKIKQYISAGYQPLNSKLTSISELASNVTGLIKLTNGVASIDENTYLTGITSSMVTTALGYTPYDSSNPSGYTTNTGTVIGSGLTADYFALGNGTVNIKISTMKPTTSSTSWSASSDVNVPTMKAISSYVTGLGYITNSVNNLTNYYKKTETYTQAEVDALISTIPKFAIEVVNALPTTDISTTTVYLLKTSETETGNLYTEYIYVNNAWESLGTQTLDLSNYVTTNTAQTISGDKTFSGSLIVTGSFTNGTYTYTLPSATGTLALYSQIPTDNASLSNGAGYITASYLTAITETEINALFS